MSTHQTPKGWPEVSPGWSRARNERGVTLGRETTVYSSVPNISFIDGDTVSLAELAEFILE